MPLNNFPEFEFEFDNWGDIAINHAETTQDSPENSNSFPTGPHPGKFSEPLDAEALHSRDQEALLKLFPFIAVVQQKIASQEFCRCQKIKASSKLY